MLSARAGAAVDAHTCKLFDDVAIKFIYGDGKVAAEYGRVARMRKRIGGDASGTWIDYNKPVDLNNRDAVPNLFIV